MKWQIGDITITKLVEMETNTIGLILPDATPERVCAIDWLKPHFITEEGALKSSIHALIVETPGATIMVDTCIGNDKNRPGMEDWDQLSGTFLQDLERAGFAPEKFDFVLCTHLHVDHVGWNTRLVDGHWVPTFPNAKYMLAKKELDFWRANNDLELGGGDTKALFAELQKLVYQDSIAPILDAGLEQVVEMDQQICDGVRLVPTPGHSPGHVSVMIESQGQSAIISGDFVHHPCQIAHSDWSTIVDDDGQMSADTRRRMFNDLADTATLFIGTHFSDPTAGHIARDGASYKLKV